MKTKKNETELRELFGNITYDMIAEQVAQATKLKTAEKIFEDFERYFNLTTQGSYKIQCDLFLDDLKEKWLEESCKHEFAGNSGAVKQKAGVEMKGNYSFKWKVTSGYPSIFRGEDKINFKEDTSLEVFKEAIRCAISEGSDCVYGQRLQLCQQANTCECGCTDWCIFKPKKQKKACVEKCCK